VRYAERHRMPAAGGSGGAISRLKGLLAVFREFF
jgi:hypothetical protein